MVRILSDAFREMLNFQGTNPIQLDAGMRMNGNASRGTSRPKHNFRLIFRNDYGAGRLEYPLFGIDAPAERFNAIILRGGNGNSGFIQQHLFTTMPCIFAISVPGCPLMGYPEALQQEVHVYFNGLYWGCTF